jgi:hypothetical protein
MAIQSVLRPKRVVEVMPVEADFTKYLLSGEIIDTAEVAVLVFSGEDPDPSAMLYDSVEIAGAVVSQRIAVGIAGVVYIIKFTVQTSLDRQLVWFMHLAILPNGVPADNLYISLYLTTPLYPLDFLDAMDSTPSIENVLIFQWPVDPLESTPSIISGTLRAILQTYVIPVEAIDSTITIESGTLEVKLIQYSIPPEAIDSVPEIISGILKVGLIGYTNWPAEAIDSTPSIIAGSLV